MPDTVLINQSSSRSTKSTLNVAVVKNWKTTLIGFILAFSGFVAYSPASFGGEKALIVQLCKYLNLTGFAALGLVSKDFNSNGDKKLEASNPVTSNSVSNQSNP